ncbi:MAG: tyrosine-type recombinase/integrase [Candidatus Pacearchaeota archaeon]
MKLDPYKHKENYLKWKENNKERIPGVSSQNSEVILKYLSDMERGINIANGSVKGSRSHSRLISLKNRLIFFSNKFRELYELNDLTKINEDKIMEFFADMRNGAITRQDGKPFVAPADYVKAFKAFWHWHQKVSKKKGIEIPDITLDLDTSRDKPKWVYLTEEQVKLLSDNAKFDYRVLIMFLFDTGIRAPTELMNLKVSDFFNDFKELNIREEISKTFGRRIKLMISSELIKEFVKNLKLSPEDHLFTKSPSRTNQYLQRLAKRILGEGKSEAGQKYSELTMYDFRHCSCCYWLPRYKSESALKYRFGWKKSDKIHYYSELLGMKDTISQEDMLLDLTKTEIEQRLEKSEKEKAIMQERLATIENYLKQFGLVADKMEGEIKN